MKPPTVPRFSPVKPSDIVSHGRNAHGMHVFTCYAHSLGQYSTDTRNRRNAAREARDYFTRLHRAGGAQ